MKKIALVTGATAGIGRACAEVLSQNNFNLIITGRRTERLEELKGELEKNGSNVLCLSFDIRSFEETKAALEQMDEQWKSIDVLINNAGLAAGLEPIHKGNVENWERMIDTNVKGLLYISRIVSPWMCERKSGHIINIGSIAGKEVYLNGNVYCGTFTANISTC